MTHFIPVLFGLLLWSGLCLPASAAQKPNILHIHADDLRADGLHALGTPELQTPHLDALVKRGTAFAHAYTQGSMVGAVCTPSRTMLLTGRSWMRIPQPRASGAQAGDPATFLPRVMAGAGYQTYHHGKPGNAFTAGINAFEQSIHSTGPREEASPSMADQTLGFLQKRLEEKEKRPFYIYLAPPVPHDPRLAESRFHALYDPAKIPLSPSFLPVHPWDNGEMTVRDEKLAPWPRTPENTRKQLADYYACITGLDHHVGRIFEALRSSGELENTLVVFSSDNGLSMGDHGLFGKQNLYEFGGMHVPLVIAGPGIPHGKSSALVYLMDLFSTFADYGGATVPEGVEGRSLRPILEGKSAGVREVLYTGYRDCMRAIRDQRWKLIRYPLVDKTQLFDLDADPRELHNLADFPEHGAKLAEMIRLLEKQMSEYGDNHPLKIANPQPAEWSPPAASPEDATRKKKKRAKAPQ